MADTEPADDGVYIDGYCSACQEDSDEYPDEYGVDGRAAREAVNAAMELRDYELPIWHMPGQQRDVSAEWECTRGAQTACHALSILRDDCGQGIPWEYHSDSTCDGEIVFSRFNLRSREGAAQCARHYAVLQNLHRARAVGLGPSAGHHIHVGARNYDGVNLSPNSLVSLYSAFTHCENLLYRLASAGWSEHRTGGADSGYARSLPSTDKNLRSIGNAFGRGKFYGLNLSNYLGSIAGCSCGAYEFGEWESCHCRDRGFTVEFRLWNAAVSPRKVRCYLGLSHGLVQWASENQGAAAADLPENLWTGSTENPGSARERQSLARQAGFLLRLTADDTERESLEWLLSISPGCKGLALSLDAAATAAGI